MPNSSLTTGCGDPGCKLAAIPSSVTVTSASVTVTSGFESVEGGRSVSSSERHLRHGRLITVEQGFREPATAVVPILDASGRQDSSLGPPKKMATPAIAGMVFVR